MEFKNLSFKILLLLMVASLLFENYGCASFRKKFIRQKKTGPTEEVIAVPQEYPAPEAEVAYDSHFNYWKTWIEELIDRVTQGENKKNRECLSQALQQIKAMQGYLTADKQKELQVYIDQLDSMTGPINIGNLTEAEALNLRRRLEILLLNVEKKFYTKKVKKWIQASSQSE